MLSKKKKEKTQNTGKYRLWAGRSDGQLSDIVIALGESISLDKELYLEDLRGSSVHAQMLCKIGILQKQELNEIQKGLSQIREEIENGSFAFDIALEDIHTHIEKRLVEICPDAGRRLHTARSRNDQVALDTHLYVITRAIQLAKEILQLCTVLLQQASSHTDTLLPGYTHLQIAQPIRLSHHLLAYFWSFIRDLKRCANVVKGAGYLPLGSGAFAGVNYQTDRIFMQKELGFHSIYSNSMDAISSRDHILDFIYFTAVFMTHASRLSEEIVLWHSQEFAFLSLPDHLTTGSSIMPQKKNPDLAELIRGKTGRLQANLHNLFTNLKGLPMSYNRDLQEDRFPLLDSYKQTLLCVKALTAMISEAQYNASNMHAALQKGFAVATDLADALVQEKGIAFRDAHHLVGHLVQYCVEHKLSLDQVNREERRKISSYFEDDAFYKAAIDIRASVEKKRSYGGTSLYAQKEQLRQAQDELNEWKKYNWPDCGL